MQRLEDISLLPFSLEKKNKKSEHFLLNTPRIPIFYFSYSQN